MLSYKMMAKQGPKVRNACEECHNRKTKCVIGPDGGACNACQVNSRECYFKPRFKSGRPFREPSDQRRNPVPSEQAQVFEFTAVPVSPASSGTLEYQDPIQHQKSASLSNTIMRESDLALDQGRLEFGHLQSPPMMHTNGVSQFQAGYQEVSPSSLSVMGDHSFLAKASSLPLYNPIRSSSPTHAGSEQRYPASIVSPLSSRVGYNAVGNMGYTTPPNSYSSGLGLRSTGIGDAGTTFTLEQCLKLQRELDSLQEALNSAIGLVVPDEIFRSVLTTLSLNCEMIPSLLPTGSIGSSKQITSAINTGLLATFAIRKVLDMFSALFQSQIQKPRSLDDILLFKRLEINITDLHFGLTQIKQHCPFLQAVVDEGFQQSSAILHNLQELAA